MATTFSQEQSATGTTFIQLANERLHHEFQSPARLAAFAVVASTGVRADEADGSQFALKIDGARTRAEVIAEAATVAATRSTEPAGSRVAAQPRSSVDPKAVRAEAAQALRLGQIPSGEAGRM